MPTPLRLLLLEMVIAMTSTLSASESDESGSVTGGPESPSPEVVNAWQYVKDQREPIFCFRLQS